MQRASGSPPAQHRPHSKCSWRPDWPHRLLARECNFSRNCDCQSLFRLLPFRVLIGALRALVERARLQLQLQLQITDHSRAQSIGAGGHWPASAALWRPLGRAHSCVIDARQAARAEQVVGRRSSCQLLVMTSSARPAAIPPTRRSSIPLRVLRAPVD